MTLVRPTTIMASTFGVVDPRWRLAITGMQIAKTPRWSKKPMTLRNVPFTAVSPRPKQLAVRIAFGRIAKGAKGQKMTGTLPPAAELIRQNRERIKAAAAALPSIRETKRTIHTLEDLEKLAQQRGITVTV